MNNSAIRLGPYRDKVCSQEYGDFMTTVYQADTSNVSALHSMVMIIFDQSMRAMKNDTIGFLCVRGAQACHQQVSLWIPPHTIQLAPSKGGVLVSLMNNV
jgi:hypothetical protein